MIKVENINVYNLARAVYSSRNALNSWAKSDSDLEHDILGENDLKLAKQLVKAGQEHRKFMRQIFVSMDITAPRYWWEQAATYKVGVTMNSCSTMHRITSKEIVLSDFSYENFIVDGSGHYYEASFEDCLESVVSDCEWLRKKYLETKDKKYWNALIWLLPQSYNQKRTVTMNYEVLYQMYHQRKNHKLQEWHDFCDVIKTLPYAEELIIGEEANPFTWEESEIGKDLKKALTPELKKVEVPASDKAHIIIKDGDDIIWEYDVPYENNITVPFNGAMSGTINACDVDCKVAGWNLYESKDPMVSHPDHYRSKNGIEVIDVIESFTDGLNGIEATDTGNIIKYACRWHKKGNEIQDVEKIIWYATHLLECLKEKKKGTDEK